MQDYLGGVSAKISRVKQKCGWQCRMPSGGHLDNWTFATKTSHSWVTSYCRSSVLTVSYRFSMIFSKMCSMKLWLPSWEGKARLENIVVEFKWHRVRVKSRC
jgi:hypothetical protein